MKTLSCRDMGVDCDFKAIGSTEDEVLRQAAEHAKKDHGMQDFSEEMKAEARQKIRDIQAA